MTKRFRIDSETGAQKLASIIAVTGLAFEARIIAGTGVTVVSSPGAAALAATLEKAIEKRMAAGAEGCRGIISFGVCGGLKPQLKAGTVIVADAVVDGERYFKTDCKWSAALAAALPHAHRGVLASAAAPVASLDEKVRLYRATGALAVDMESRAAAAFAAARGLPFVICRAIADPAARALPPAAIAGMRADGRIALGPLLSRLMADPPQLIELVRLACDARAARKALIAARRQLGDGLGWLRG